MAKKMKAPSRNDVKTGLVDCACAGMFGPLQDLSAANKDMGQAGCRA
jgi:hypothetical protein